MPASYIFKTRRKAECLKILSDRLKRKWSAALFWRFHKYRLSADGKEHRQGNDQNTAAVSNLPAHTDHPGAVK